MQKFKETVMAASSIAVQTGSVADPSKILAAHLLHELFLSAGKKSVVRTPKVTDNIRAFIDTLLPSSGQNETEEENMLIKINTDHMPITELKYEKEGAILKIILRGKNTLDAKHLVIEKEKAPVGLLVLLDPHDDEVDTLLKTTPHADVVRLTSKTKNLFYKVAGIIDAVAGEVSKEFVHALWVLARAEEKQVESSPELLAIKTRLLDIGVDREKIRAAEEALNGPNFWKLVGRALARSEFEKELGMVWTFLPHADLEKTRAQSEHLFPLFTELRHLRPEGSFLALLYEKTPKSISAIIGGSNIDKTRELATLLGSSLASSYFVLEGFPTFSEIEIKIRTSAQKMLQ